MRSAHVAPDEQECKHHYRASHSRNRSTNDRSVSSSEHIGHSYDEWYSHEVCYESKCVSEKPESEYNRSATHLSCHGLEEYELRYRAAK